MPHFIKLTEDGGRELFINTAHIIKFYAVTSGHTFLVLTEHTDTYVVEPPAQIIDHMRFPCN